MQACCWRSPCSASICTRPRCCSLARCALPLLRRYRFHLLFHLASLRRPPCHAVTRHTVCSQQNLELSSLLTAADTSRRSDPPQPFTIVCVHCPHTADSAGGRTLLVPAGRGQRNDGPATYEEMADTCDVNLKVWRSALPFAIPSLCRAVLCSAMRCYCCNVLLLCMALHLFTQGEAIGRVLHGRAGLTLLNHHLQCSSATHHAQICHPCRTQRPGRSRTASRRRRGRRRAAAACWPSCGAPPPAAALERPDPLAAAATAGRCCRPTPAAAVAA